MGLERCERDRYTRYRVPKKGRRIMAKITYIEHNGTEHVVDVANAHTSLEYLEMARNHARDTECFFEERESWKALEAFHKRHDDKEKARKCAERLEEMERMLEE